jgi:hypothetical protein
MPCAWFPALRAGTWPSIGPPPAQNGADLVLHLPGAASLTLLGVTQANLNATDFVL